MWARLLISLNNDDFIKNTVTIDKIKDNFFTSLNSITQIEWNNLPFLLEAAYILSDKPTQEIICKTIKQKIPPAALYQFKEFFPFLQDSFSIDETMLEKVRGVGEKCKNYPTKEECIACMVNFENECWIRVLSRIFNLQPNTHHVLEIADIVIYRQSQGVYFVIKAKDITGFKGGGDTLIRQCIKLFEGDHALVFYWNIYNTEPHIIEIIKQNAVSHSTNPRFVIVSKEFIVQVYSNYELNFQK